MKARQRSSTIAAPCGHGSRSQVKSHWLRSFFLQMPMMLTRAISDISFHNVSNYATTNLHSVAPLTNRNLSE